MMCCDVFIVVCSMCAVMCDVWCVVMCAMMCAVEAES